MVSVFLYLFLVGFGLTVLSAVLGMIHLGGNGHASDVGHGHSGHGHVGHGDISHGHGADLDHGDVHGRADAVSPVNFQTLVAFLMGFGGVGYLATRLGFATVPGSGPGQALLAIPLAAIGGMAASWLIYRWLRFLVGGERPMGPTSHIGVLGRLTVGIRAGGTGEMVYSEQSTRTVSAARSVDGTAIVRGEEVVVLRYERGIAYVQPWKKFLEEEDMSRT